MLLFASRLLCTRCDVTSCSCPRIAMSIFTKRNRHFLRRSCFSTARCCVIFMPLRRYDPLILFMVFDVVSAAAAAASSTINTTLTVWHRSLTRVCVCATATRWNYVFFSSKVVYILRRTSYRRTASRPNVSTWSRLAKNNVSVLAAQPAIYLGWYSTRLSDLALFVVLMRVWGAERLSAGSGDSLLSLAHQSLVVRVMKHLSTRTFWHLTSSTVLWQSYYWWFLV